MKKQCVYEAFVDLVERNLFRNNQHYVCVPLTKSLETPAIHQWFLTGEGAPLQGVGAWSPAGKISLKGSAAT